MLVGTTAIIHGHSMSNGSASDATTARTKQRIAGVSWSSSARAH
jgi:hypothetical protein